MHTLWCIWFASSMAMPFVLGFSEPAGVVAYAGGYGFAALGMIVGLWLASHPTFNNRWGSSFQTMRTILVLGLSISVLLGLMEFSRLALLQSLEIGPWPTRLTAYVAPSEKMIIFCNTLLCGITGYWSPGLTDNSKKPLFHGLLLAAPAFVAGSIRGYVWTLFLPSPAYPLPLADWAIGAEDRWIAEMPPLLGIIVVFICMFAWSYLTTDMRGSCTKQTFSYLVCAFCLGELWWRFVTRICPPLLEISKTQAVAALLGFAACLVATVVCLRLPHERTSSKHAAQNQNETIDKSQTGSSIPDYIADILISHNLSPKEMSVLETSFIGLTSAQASEKLGVHASTVRTYRSRVCTKLGAPNIDQLIEDMKHRNGLFSSCNSESKPLSKRELFAYQLGAIGGASLLFTILMPPIQTASHWDCTWLIPYGAALGLVLTALLNLLASSFASPRRNRALKALPYIITAIHVLATISTLQCYEILAERAPYGSLSLPIRIYTIAGIAICIVVANVCIGDYLAIATPKQKSGAFVIVGVAILAILSTLGQFYWNLCMIIASILAGWSVISWSKSQKRFSNQLKSYPLLTLSCFAVLAFIWEESLRGIAYASLRYCGIVFLATATLTVVCHLCRPTDNKTSKWDFLCLAITTAILVCLRGPTYGLLTCSVLSVFAIVTWPNAACCPKPITPRWHTPHLAMAFGICTAVYAANSWDTSSATIGINMIIIAILTVLLSLPGILLVARTITPSSRQVINMNQTTLENLPLLLRMQGLTPLQVEVALCVLRGLSTSQIAYKLSYSRSRIQQVLNEIYSSLGVRSRSQLMSALLTKGHSPADTKQ